LNRDQSLEKQDVDEPGHDDLNVPTGNDRSAIIDHIYQVAVDPERYESLLDLWEEKIAPFRRANTLAETSSWFDDIEIENHAERAGTVLDRMDDRSTSTILSSITAGIDPSAAFILTDDNTLAAANRSAKAVFGVQVGSLLADLGLEKVHLEKLELEAGDIRQSTNGKTSLIRFRSSASRGTTVFKLSRLELPGVATPFILAVSSELAWPGTLGPTIREAFGLTIAEAEIVRAITEGMSLKEIAKKRGRSLETVKTQLRSALAKTDARTQSELVRLTLSLMDVVSATENQASHLAELAQQSVTLTPKAFITLERPQNRRADHLVLGDPDGQPLLFFPLDYGLTRWPASAEAYAGENGLKIMVPIRPGYGQTTNVKKRAQLVDAVIGDTLAVMDHHGVRSCPVICMSSDAFFAYHMVKQHPGRLSAILNCAPGFPMFLPQQYERMEKWHRFILANARYAPSVLPFLVKAGFSLARRIGKRGFIHAVYAKSPADIAAFEIPEVQEAMITGSQVCLSEQHSAHRAFANEVILQQHDWSEIVQRCDIPVHVWYGDDDPQVPPGSMREIIQAFPAIQYHHLENAGQLLLFTHWREILATARQYLGCGSQSGELKQNRDPAIMGRID